MTATTAVPRRSASPPALRSRRRGRADVVLAKRPVWLLPSLLVLLAASAALYVVDLSASGTANSFYAAAVQAASKSWKAWFFGSLDSSNFITVDKPPASLWIMGLSARIFGFSSWSLLLPQAVEGVATVLVVFATVRRALARFGARIAGAGGLLAGAIVAATPAAALMFRFDNPDALLTLLMAAAAHAVVRAVPRASWRWLALAGALLGLAFLTKMLQGLLVLPAFALVYLIAASTTVVRRIVHLAVAGAALVVAAGWWVLAVALWPADARPYIGGSTNNTVLELVFGYNGLGRIFGGTGNGGGGGGTSGSSFGGATGLQRLFSSEMGLEISWLLPAALIALVLGLVARRGAPRTDLARAGLIASGGWLVVTGLVFSFMSGTIHPYYTVALAPAVAGTVAIGAAVLWARRDSWLGIAGLAALAASGGTWAFVLLSEDATWLPWLRWTLLALALATAAGILVSRALGGGAGRRLLAVAVLGAVLSGLGGGAAYSIATASVPHSGSIPSAFVSVAGGTGGAGAPGGGSAVAGRGGAPGGTSGTRPSGSAPSGGTAVTSGSSSGSAASGSSASGSTTSGSSAAGSTSAGAREGGGAGGATSSVALTALLKAAGTTWSAAVDGSQSAATLELSSGTAVMAIGGWSSDPAPTLAQFEADVRAGRIHYYIASGTGSGAGMGGGTSTASAIAAWVEAHYASTTVGGTTVYDLTAAKA